MKKGQKIETKVYELLGVKLFKKATFKLEEIIHRKDKGKNINYHIKNSYSIESVNDFKKFLYYNGTIHVKNVIVGSAILLTLILFFNNPIAIVPISILTIKDLYCIMLQRFNWIKINDFEERLTSRKEKKINKKIEEIDYKELDRNLTASQVNKKELIENLQIIRSYLEKHNEVLETNIINDSISFIEEAVNNEMQKKCKRKALIKEKSKLNIEEVKINE